MVKFFGKKTATEMVADGHGADLMAANNVLAHVPDINDFVGGVAILLLFGLMMTNASDDPIVVDGSQKPFGFGVALVLGIVLVGAMSGAAWGGSLDAIAGFREVGTRLYRDYGVPFEVASLVLLVARVPMLVTSASVQATATT